jgi:hypothetical protein
MSKELPGRRSNPNNILMGYFWVTVSGAAVKGKNSSGLSLIFSKCFLGISITF